MTFLLKNGSRYKFSEKAIAFSENSLELTRSYNVILYYFFRIKITPKVLQVILFGNTFYKARIHQSLLIVTTKFEIQIQ
jgi:predicted nicotinamide N-methyase